MEGLKELVSNMYSKLRSMVDRDSRGTRLHDLILDPLHSEPHPPTSSTTPITLEIPIIEALTAHLNSVGDMTYLPAYRAEAPSGPHSHCLLHGTAVSLPALKYGGTTYRPHFRSEGDSNVMIRPAGSGNLFPGRLELVFLHERVEGAQILKDLFCLIRPLRPLDVIVQHRDFFKQFEMGGALWSTDWEDDSRLLIIRPQSLVCHFARTAFEAQDTQVGLPTFHVLPLDRVCTSSWLLGDCEPDVSLAQDSSYQLRRTASGQLPGCFHFSRVCRWRRRGRRLPR